MTNITQLIRDVSLSKAVRQDIVEKDYAISFLLSAISSTPGFSQNLVLKGGTALRKLFFPGYRFSEDLDYSTLQLGQIDGCDNLMEETAHNLTQSLNERGPFEVKIEQLVLREPHPGNQKAYIVRIKFPAHRTPLCRLKVEITVDEPIIRETEILPVLHEFPDEFEGKILAYSISEITSEKLRAFLQSKERLEGKGWGASRVCRDYYDLWNLLQVPGNINPALIELINMKCEIRKVTYNSPKDFISENLIDVAKNEWNQQLLPFVPSALPIEEILTQVKKMIVSIWD